MNVVVDGNMGRPILISAGWRVMACKELEFVKGN